MARQRPSSRVPVLLAAGLLTLLAAAPAPAQFGPDRWPRGRDPFDQGRLPGDWPRSRSTVWYCSGCKFELGHGSEKPLWRSCPRCGARFSNANIPFTLSGPMQDPGPSWPATRPFGSGLSPASTRSSPANPFGKVLGAMLGLGVLLLILIVAAARLLYSVAGSATRLPVRARRRQRVYHDDEDDN